jgi:ATP-binding cassette subfamily B protein
VIEDCLGSLITIVGLLLLLAHLHPLIPAVMLAALGPQVAAAVRARRQAHWTRVRQSRTFREMEYCARVTTEPGAAKEIRVFGLGGEFLRRFRERRDATQREMEQVGFQELRIQTVLGGAHTLVLAGSFAYVAVQAGAGRLSIGDVALYLGAITQAEQRLLTFANTVGLVYEAFMLLRRLFPFLDNAAPAIALPPPDRARAAPPVLRTGVELRSVTFAYPESSAPVLDEVSAVLPAGKVTALVGANGAGKSTLVKLLTRMYDPSASPMGTQPPGPPDGAQSPDPSEVGRSPGEILHDGVPLPAYDLGSLRQRIAVVYQDFARFALTLEENIAVGAFRPGASADETGPDGLPRRAQVEQAASWAGAGDLAAKLPQGYDTQLTRRFAGGVELSGGEWQKVALARAFVRDAALVILDEPTAALDADAEYRLFQQFRELIAGKTALLISHRFSTVRMADHILVLEGGRIAEAGTHEDLIALGGRYATLYEMQAGRYR